MFPGSTFYLELLRKIDYLVCNYDLEEEMDDEDETEAWDSDDTYEFFISFLNLNRFYKNIWPRLNVIFNIKYDFHLNTAKTNRRIARIILKKLSFFKTFAEAYRIKFFIVNAFDTQSSGGNNGWWKIKNFTDLLSPKNYVEKVPGKLLQFYFVQYSFTDYKCEYIC